MQNSSTRRFFQVIVVLAVFAGALVLTYNLGSKAGYAQAMSQVETPLEMADGTMDSRLGSNDPIIREMAWKDLSKADKQSLGSYAHRIIGDSNSPIRLKFGVVVALNMAIKNGVKPSIDDLRPSVMQLMYEDGEDGTLSVQARKLFARM